MQQIAADGVPPVHIAPIQPERIPLVEQVVCLANANQTVRVVVPAERGREVQQRAVIRRVHRGFVGGGNAGQQGIIRITGENFQRLTEPRGRIHAADEISVIRRAEANICLLNFSPGKQEMQLAEGRIAARREEQKRGSKRNHHRKNDLLTADCKGEKGGCQGFMRAVCIFVLKFSRNVS